MKITAEQFTAHLAALEAEREKAIAYRNAAAPETGSPYNCEEWLIRHKVVTTIGCTINDFKRDYYGIEDSEECYYGSDRYFEDGYEAGYCAY